jgi:hypothetical protein
LPPARSSLTTGGGLLLRVLDADSTEALDRIRDGDPFTKHKIAQYELLTWDVKTGREISTGSDER